MKQHLNTLFVTTHGAYLAKDGQAVAVRVARELRLRVPLHNLGGIVCFGRVGCSPALMGMCAKAGVAITFLTQHGRLLARVTGFTPGNVLVRREQYRRADDPVASTLIARDVLTAKVANSRSVLLRAARDYPASAQASEISHAAARLGHALADVQRADNLEQLRGLEGDAARCYFAVFNGLITNQGDGFVFRGRNRRPPLDNVNALLSFLYTMLTHDARSACEAAGLDPAVGFLHRDRPGRPGLALDLVEEFRAYLADRVTLSLINRQQVRPPGFLKMDSGAVVMDEQTRKTVITAYQKRKQETVTHPFLGEKTTVGLLVHLQARLLSRYLRGELDAYPAFIA
ncbi:MAG: type I-C CRISPR-associated endonuclease Cas1, partial [Phycisphaerae bacterium]|nr:type I-C CRISPR-associated endonuclease Cas1 [Phycisphaerae bacterium]